MHAYQFFSSRFLPTYLKNLLIYKFFYYVSKILKLIVYFLSGYQFNQQQVPGQFNFSPNHPSNFRFGGN